MNRKRERLEIIHDILKAIQDKGDKVKPTHILYKSNLSHQMLTEYFKELISGRFIEEKEEGKKRKSKVYSLTNKGYNYIRDFKLIQKFTESYGLD